MYKYFVLFKVGKFTMGNGGIECSRKIKGIEDIREIEQRLKKDYNLKEVQVLNFRLF